MGTFNLAKNQNGNIFSKFKKVNYSIKRVGWIPAILLSVYLFDRVVKIGCFSFSPNLNWSKHKFLSNVITIPITEEILFRGHVLPFLETKYKLEVFSNS